MRGPTRRGLAAAALVVVAAAGRAAAQQPPPPPTPPPSESELERSRQQLEEVRRERERLQREMERLRGRVHSLSSELQNLERQVETTERIMSELDLQIRTMGSQIDRITADLTVAEDALAEKRAILHRRLIDISKRGPLFTAQVLLRAESFGDLVSRYKYLYLQSRQDRQLVGDVEALRDRVADQRNSLLRVQSDLARRRDERAEENRRFRALEGQRSRSLRESRRSADRLAARLAQLDRDFARLSSRIAEFERRRLAAEAAAGAAAAPSRIRTSDLGQLDWPVDGELLYRFGRQQLPNNTTIRWNGIGIGAPAGTPVHAIAAGTVRLAEPYGTYGHTVVIDHGGGYYSVYAQLAQIAVRVGESVAQGQVVGRSGGETTDEGPHLHFEIREIRGREAQAVDPILWLRRRGGGDR